MQSGLLPFQAGSYLSASKQATASQGDGTTLGCRGCALIDCVPPKTPANPLAGAACDCSSSTPFASWASSAMLQFGKACIAIGLL